MTKIRWPHRLNSKSIHPLGKSPILQDKGDAVGDVTLVESGAICEYLCRKTAGLLGPPAAREDALRYYQFLHYAEGSLMPLLFDMLFVGRVPLLGKASARRARPLLDVHLDFVEAELTSRPWFAGKNITAADVMMSFPLEA